MPLFFDRTPGGTSINIDSDVPKRSRTTLTSARKFSSLDISQQQETRGVEVKSNDEHLIEHAASLKGVAVAAESIAESARQAIATVREQLGSTPGSSQQDTRTAFPLTSEFDVASLADVKSKSLAMKLQSVVPSLDTNAIAEDLHKNIAGNVFKNKLDVPAPASFNPVVPQLSNITVEMDKNRGTIDCFFAHLKFTLPFSQVTSGKIKAVRIFRSTIVNPVFSRGSSPVLSIRGLEKLSPSRMRTQMKVSEHLSTMSYRYSEAGVLTALSVLNPIDVQTNKRIGTNFADSLVAAVPNSVAPASTNDTTSQRVSSFLDSGKFGNLDSSVSLDQNVIRNIKMQDAASAVVNIPQAQIISTSLVSRQGLLNPSQIPTIGRNTISQLISDNYNNQEFRQIAVISLDKVSSNIIGELVQFDFIDESIGFGRGYKYYVTSIDTDMIESVRSQIVDVTVEGIRVPERPKRVFSYNVAGGIAFSILVDDQLVEKFEVYRREDNIALATQKIRISRNFSDISGYNTNFSSVTQGENNFIKIGECLNASITQGSNYYDREVKPGLTYLYRIFSVDIFGNKSESPFEVSVFVPDRSTRNSDLKKPTLTGEVDSKTGKALLVFKCADDRVRNLFLSRRDLTLNQSAFTTPGQVNFIKFGNPDAGKTTLAYEDVVLRGEKIDVSWNGLFENSQSEIRFVDKSAQVDHIYQYKIYGVDKYGNSTPHEICKPFLIVNRPLIDAPVNLLAEVLQGPRFTVGGIQLTWQEANIDIATEDLLGDQTDLARTAVRTLYQVERRKVGEEQWYEFPMIKETSYFDPAASVLGQENPGFRPPLVEKNQTYVYRVKALQTGSFVSNYGKYVEVFAALNVSPPSNFRLRSSSAQVNPFYIVLNWDTPNQSGIVDKWEIERVEVNNIAASRLNVKNPSDFQTLNFSPFRTVFKESSRSLSQQLDLSISVAQDAKRTQNLVMGSKVNQTLFTGNHAFQDTMVRFGNTYFYRIRSVGVDGSYSSWVYRGMKLTDGMTEKMIGSLITPGNQKILSDSMVPLVFTDAGSAKLSSFSFQPSFSTVRDISTVTVGGSITPQVSVSKPVPLPTYSANTLVSSVASSRASILSTGNNSLS